MEVQMEVRTLSEVDFFGDTTLFHNKPFTNNSKSHEALLTHIDNRI